MKNKFAKNIPLLLLNNFSSRINFFPILSIYYLTLNNTEANQVWLYMWIWYLAWFIFEIPSGYLSDILWHKKAIILSKISFLLSVSCYIWASFVEYPLFIFILAMVFQMLWKSMTSWSDKALLYDSLKNINREEEFTKVQAKITAVASLISTFIILWIPFLTKISIITPFYVIVLQYLIWFVASLLLVDTKNHKNIDKNNKKKIKDIIKENKWFWLFPYLLFGYMYSSFSFAESAFRPLYMENLWMPIIFIWSAMWLSRAVWYLFHSIAFKLENNFKLKHIYLGQLIFWVIYYILIASLNNPYIIALLMWIWLGFIRIMWDLPAHFIIKHIKDDNYKATMLSIWSQIGLLFRWILALILGYIMNISYKLWFLSFGIIMWISMTIIYFFVIRTDLEK
jgi:MFS family permease